MFLKEYDAPTRDWERAGTSPLEDLRIALPYRFRITKRGYQTIEGALGGAPPRTFRLELEGSIPPDMVSVPGRNFQPWFGGPAHIDGYWIDRYEVTNRQFKQFVDAGGYRERKYWKEQFVKDGRVLSWEQAMSEFRDSTGRPGPATWELGEYPQDRDNYPVNGVSWYEAAAYAEFAGKQLPTIYHWRDAADPGMFSNVLKFSNFSGAGPAPVGSYPGLGPFGTYDMAGNVKEWCWNASGSQRYILGGAWNEPVYMFRNEEAKAPFDRSATNGFRCVRYQAKVPDSLLEEVTTHERDYRKEKPVSDNVYRIYRSLYHYDRTELKPVIESVDESSPYWRMETITCNAAYWNERIPVYVFLPRKRTPPYQTIIYFPAGSAFQVSTVADDVTKIWDFIPRSGRAFVLPIYKGTYERRVTSVGGQNAYRDLLMAEVKDFGRTLDYLETRSDLDATRFGYYGVSSGARLGPVMIADETRIKAAALIAVGLPLANRLPEADEINFLPHVKAPVLMVSGRYDFLHPYETTQAPMFKMLGTPEADKRHVVEDTGHIPSWQLVIKETLDWFDRYLGPVK